MKNNNKNELTEKLGISPRVSGFQSFAGSDVRVTAYVPLIYSPGTSTQNSYYKEFAEIQTLSISSTRSISPVRVLGKSSVVGYTRGARTFAGTMVFASVNHDVFKEMYSKDVAESTLYHSTSIVSDQLPPFNITITAANEKGGVVTQGIYGITLVNYGTTYSIDDLYTEVTYTYVAQDVGPLSDVSISLAKQTTYKEASTVSPKLKTVSDISAKDQANLTSLLLQTNLFRNYTNLPGSTRSTILRGPIIPPGPQLPPGLSQ